MSITFTFHRRKNPKKKKNENNNLAEDVKWDQC